MKTVYKQKASDYISAIQLRVDQVQQMMSGAKQANSDDAKAYLSQVQKGLAELQELVDIS